MWCNVCMYVCMYTGADKSLARPGRKQANVSVRMVWISFGALPCKNRNLMTARVSILLESRSFRTFFRACFLPGRVKDLSAPGIYVCMYVYDMYAWLYMYVIKICTHVRMYVHVCTHVCMLRWTNNRYHWQLVLKTGILICLKTVRVYWNMLEIRL